MLPHHIPAFKVEDEAMLSSEIEKNAAPQPHDLVFGLLAALAQRGVETLRTDDTVLHGAFGTALNVFRKSNGDLAVLADYYYADAVTDNYDELNNALIEAQSFDLIGFPNPSYSKLEVKIAPDAAEKMLRSFGANRKTIENAADAFLLRMRR
jgi:hypothetical protein